MAKKAADSFDPSDFMRLFDPSQMMEQFSNLWPKDSAGSGAMNINAVIAIQQKNMQALTSANQQVLRGATQVAQKQMELFQQSAAEIAAIAGSMSASGANPQQLMAQQTELMTNACAKTLDSIRESSDTIARAQQQALATLEQRWQEVLQELREQASG